MGEERCIRSFRLERKGVARVLGSLEAKVMNVVWSLGHATIRDVREELSRTKPAAFTTIMTVMNRLARKGILRRERDQGVYLYTPTQTQEEFLRSISKDVALGLVRDFSPFAIAEFVEALDEVDPSRFEELERLIRQRKGSNAGENDS